MDPFHISMVFRNGSCHSWVNFNGGKWKLAQIKILHSNLIQYQKIKSTRCF